MKEYDTICAILGKGRFTDDESQYAEDRLPMGNIGKKRNKNMKKIILPAVLLATGTVMASITSSSIVG